MTVTEVIDTLQTRIRNADDEYDREEMGRVAGLKEALHEIKKIEPCEDAISRQAVLNILDDMVKGYINENDFDKAQGVAWVKVQKLPPVTPQPKTGHCKECKYFELNSVETVYGIPLIVHEICSKWGNGCKTREDGYCFLFESQESEVQDANSD